MCITQLMIITSFADRGAAEVVKRIGTEVRAGWKVEG